MILESPQKVNRTFWRKKPLTVPVDFIQPDLCAFKFRKIFWESKLSEFKHTLNFNHTDSFRFWIFWIISRIMLNILKIRFEPCKQQIPKCKTGIFIQLETDILLLKTKTFFGIGTCYWHLFIEFNLLYTFLYFAIWIITFDQYKMQQEATLTIISCSNNSVFVTHHLSYCRVDPWLSLGSVTSLVTLHSHHPHIIISPSQ